MINVESYRQNAADCLRQAEAQAEPEDKNLLLNVALAWVRLAHQVREVGIPAHSEEARADAATAPEASATQAADPPPAGAPAATKDETIIENLGKALVTH
jgi:hypothetical protein